MRDELISYMKSLSDKKHQEQCWVLKNCPKGSNDELDYSIHFLFDDTALSERPQKLIGDILLNEHEAELVKAVCEHIDMILNKYGSELSDEEYISTQEWKNVLSSSKTALYVLKTAESS